MIAQISQTCRWMPFRSLASDRRQRRRVQPWIRDEPL